MGDVIKYTEYVQSLHDRWEEIRTCTYVLHVCTPRHPGTKFITYSKSYIDYNQYIQEEEVRSI